MARDAGVSAFPSPALGGSQIGGRIRYRLARSGTLSASLRFYAPADRLKAGDVAAGLDWRPVGTIPAGLLVERRQAFGPDGRSAFSLTAYGGISTAVGRAAIDLYGQAGIVGARNRDMFADGIAAVRFQLDDALPVKVGAGAWAAAQPGAARVDIGPTIALRPADAPVTIALDWRQRIAGNAAPDSGPVLSLAVGF
ncbi:hypothetical protein IC614_09545 [Allosphingosinicella flava]|uniref:Haemolysin activator HlyB C-terminal domain-containing protein n=1 Tax=Allosphingosinicella flava TaxID=2771430 RepID=A0A7T2GIM0_9SPHN|nr:hypothetical protein [Sphingosinicella flava]QPQ54569.1 hypothetical protein IC614_09545 [Sphingosinicella flava]